MTARSDHLSRASAILFCNYACSNSRTKCKGPVVKPTSPPQESDMQVLSYQPSVWAK